MILLGCESLPGPGCAAASGAALGGSLAGHGMSQNTRWIRLSRDCTLGCSPNSPPRWRRTHSTKSTRPEQDSNNYDEPMETLRVGSAFPDPPFNGMPDNSGLDIDLMTAIAEALGARVEFISYDGADFNGIFDALGSAYDCVPAGTTVTP